MIVKRDIIFDKLFLQLMVVNILIGLVQPMNQFVDSALTGKGLGTAALQAYALFMPIASLAIAVSCVFSIGTQISCSHQIGKGNFKEAQKLLQTSLSSAFLFSAVFTAVLFAFSEKIAVLSGASEAVSGQIKDTEEYISGYAFGIVPMFLTNILIFLLQLEGKKRLAVVCSLCVFFVNAAGDLANLYIFKGGLFGMAFATSLSNMAAFAGVLIYFLFFSSVFRFSLKGFDADGFKRIIRNGMPSLTYYGSLVVRTAFFNHLILTEFEGGVLAVMLVVNSFTTLVDAAIGGTGDATLLLGGIVFGEKNKNAARQLLQISLAAGVSLLALITVLTFVFSGAIAALFSDSAETALISETARALKLSALCFVPDVAACVLKKYIQSVGRSTYTSVTNVLCNVVYVCAAAYWLVKYTGSDGLYLSFTVCYVLILFTHIAYAFIIAGNGLKGKRDMFLYLPNDYDVPDENIWEASADNADGVARASEQMQDFCKERRIDKEQRFRVALLIEEITDNILKHGFKENRKNVIVLRCVIRGRDITLLIKDNCSSFNPEHYYEMFRNEEDKTKNMGIRIVMGVAKNVSYTNRFNLNHLIVKL